MRAFFSAKIILFQLTPEAGRFAVPLRGGLFCWLDKGEMPRTNSSTPAKVRSSPLTSLKGKLPLKLSEDRKKQTLKTNSPTLPLLSAFVAHVVVTTVTLIVTCSPSTRTTPRRRSPCITHISLPLPTCLFNVARHDNVYAIIHYFSFVNSPSGKVCPPDSYYKGRCQRCKTVLAT